MSPHFAAHGDDGTVLIACPTPARTANEVERVRRCIMTEANGIEHGTERLLPLRNVEIYVKNKVIARVVSEDTR